MLVPVFKLAEVSFIVWPFILLVDLLAIALAVLTAALLPVLAVLLLTLAATGALIFKIPSDLTGLPVSFFLLGAFAVFFVAASVWLVKRFKPDALKSGIKFGDDPAAPGDVAAHAAGLFHRAAVPAAHHGDVAAAVARIRRRSSGWRCCWSCCCSASTKLFSLDWMPAVGLVVRDRAGMRLAFQPFRSRESKPAAEPDSGVVFDFLRRVRAVSVSVPETILRTRSFRGPPRRWPDRRNSFSSTVSCPAVYPNH